MPPTQSRLEKLLHWRRREYQAEEHRLAEKQTVLIAIRANIERSKSSRLSVSRNLAEQSSVLAFELKAAQSYCLGAQQQEASWIDDTVGQEVAIQVQSEVVRKAHLRVRLLEKLFERRADELQQAEAREFESAAAELYLCKFSGVR